MIVDNGLVAYERVVDGGWDQRALCCKRLEAHDNQYHSEWGVDNWVMMRALVENRPLIQGPNRALVPGNIAPGTRETFTSGWWLQPGVKLLSRLVAWPRTGK